MWERNSRYAFYFLNFSGLCLIQDLTLLTEKFFQSSFLDASEVHDSFSLGFVICSPGSLSRAEHLRLLKSQRWCCGQFIGKSLVKLITTGKHA